MDIFELDIDAVLRRKLNYLSERDLELLFNSVVKIANEIGINEEPLFMILLDSVSGEQVLTREQIEHQFLVFLENNNLYKG